MKINKNYLQTLVFLALYLFATWHWSAPYQNYRIPYGEFDAISHFEVADYMSYNDKSFMRLPDYIDLRYGTDNNFKPHTLWYPPTFHSALAISESITGDRMLGVYLMNTLLATFILVSLYFVMNSLFGFLPAILSSLLVIFSPRDYMPFLWGQWPERFSYAFIPLILYCFYKYFISYKLEKKPIYLFIGSLLIGAQALVHALALFHSLITIFVMYVIFCIRQKKIIFNMKHFSIALILFLVLFFMFPYQSFNIFTNLGRENRATAQEPEISRLLHWSLPPQNYQGSVPASYFSYKQMHGTWTIPFIIAGLLVVLLRRKDEDWLIISWLIGLYIVLHRDLFGFGNFLHRSLSATSHIFVPLMAIGAVYIAYFLKIGKYREYAKYVLCGVFVYFAFSVNMKESSGTLNNVYTDLTQPYNFFVTLSPPQYEAARWEIENVPPNLNISVLGIPHQENYEPATSKKIRWSAAVAQRPSRFHYLFENDTAREEHARPNYLKFDYSMLGPLSSDSDIVQLFNDMQDYELNASKTHLKVYDKNDIRIYKPK